MEPKIERSCGDCNECCKWLQYEVFGRRKFPGRPCHYLGKNCTIHEHRPQSCRDYWCGYIKNVVPEWMKPSVSKVLVNVEGWGPNRERPMLRAVECGEKMDSKYLSWFVQNWIETGLPVIYQIDGVWNYLGDREFLEWFREHNPMTQDLKRG